METVNTGKKPLTMGKVLFISFLTGLIMVGIGRLAIYLALSGIASEVNEIIVGITFSSGYLCAVIISQWELFTLQNVILTLAAQGIISAIMGYLIVVFKRTKEPGKEIVFYEVVLTVFVLSAGLNLVVWVSVWVASLTRLIL